VIKPMAAPVLGGILIADEVIDLLLPVLFYWVRRRRILARSGYPAQTDLRIPEPTTTSQRSPLPLGEG
jgi:Cu(I)/Ag(I) efflux system membrane protein CusA/SilA